MPGEHEHTLNVWTAGLLRRPDDCICSCKFRSNFNAYVQWHNPHIVSETNGIWFHSQG